MLTYKDMKTGETMTVNHVTGEVLPLRASNMLSRLMLKGISETAARTILQSWGWM